MTDPTQSSDAHGMERALWAVAILAVVATVGAGLLAGARPALGVGIGGLVGLANLWAIGRVVRGLVAPVRGRVPWALVAAAKFALLFGGLYLLVKSGVVELVPVVIGYGALPLGIVTGGVGVPRPVGKEG